MGYVVLWIEVLAVLLLGEACLLVWIGRRRSRWLRCTAWAAAVLAVVLPLMLATLAWRNVFYYSSPYSYYVLATMAFFFLCGSIGLERAGLRRTDGLPAPTAAGVWSAQKLALALGVFVILTMITVWNLDLAARQQLDGLRVEATGMALSIAPPAVSNRDNAAGLYERALEGFFPLPAEEQELIQAWNEKEQIEAGLQKGPRIDVAGAEVKAFSQKYAARLALLRAAAAKPDCYVQTSYAWPWWSAWTELYDGLYKAIPVLRLDAAAKTATGDVAAAVDDINAMFGVARQIAACPGEFAMVLSMGYENVALMSIQQLVATNRASAKELAKLEIDDLPNFRRLRERAWLAEDAQRLYNFYAVGAGQLNIAQAKPVIVRVTRDQHGKPLPTPDVPCPSPTAFDAAVSVVYRLFVLPGELHNFRQASEAVRAVLKEPYSATPLAEWQQLDRRFRCMIGPLTNMAQPGPMWFFRMGEVEARRQVTRVGLAAYAYRAQHGHWPGKPTALVPEFLPWPPVDLFDGKPLRMKRTESGLVIYSVGADGVNNDGTPFTWAHTPRETDITFTLTNAQP